MNFTDSEEPPKTVSQIKTELAEESRIAGCYDELVDDRTGYMKLICEIHAGRETVAGAIATLLKPGTEV